MKKIIVLFMILVLSLSLAGCRKKISLNDIIEKDSIKTMEVYRNSFYSTPIAILEDKKLMNPIIKVLNVPYVELSDGELVSEEIDVCVIWVNSGMEKECDFYIYPNGKIELLVSYNHEVKRYMSTEKINLDKLNKLIHKRNCKEN